MCMNTINVDSLYFMVCNGDRVKGLAAMSIGHFVGVVFGLESKNHI